MWRHTAEGAEIINIEPCLYYCEKSLYKRAFFLLLLLLIINNKCKIYIVDTYAPKENAFSVSEQEWDRVHRGNVMDGTDLIIGQLTAVTCLSKVMSAVTMNTRFLTEKGDVGFSHLDVIWQTNEWRLKSIVLDITDAGFYGVNSRVKLSQWNGVEQLHVISIWLVRNLARLDARWKWIHIQNEQNWARYWALGDPTWKWSRTRCLTVNDHSLHPIDEIGDEPR